MYELVSFKYPGKPLSNDLCALLLVEALLTKAYDSSISYKSNQ